MKKNAQATSIEAPLATIKEENIYVYGSYPLSNPEQDCEKILAWFNDHFVLSNEEAVHELKIGNLSKHIPELQKHGYEIYSLLITSEITPTYCTMMYVLHRYVSVSEKMTQFLREAEAWTGNGNLLVPNDHVLVDWNYPEPISDDTVDYFLKFNPLFQKMQARGDGVA